MTETAFTYIASKVPEIARAIPSLFVLETFTVNLKDLNGAY